MRFSLVLPTAVWWLSIAACVLAKMPDVLPWITKPVYPRLVFQCFGKELKAVEILGCSLGEVMGRSKS